MIHVSGKLSVRYSGIQNFLIAVLLLSAIPLMAVDVSLPDVSMPAGKEVFLAIQTSDLTGKEIYSVDFTLVTDATVVTITDVSTSGTATAGWGDPTANVQPGRLTVSSGGTSALTGSGDLITIHLRVKDGTTIGTTIPLTFSRFMFNEGTPSVTLSNGTITVIADTEPPRIIRGPRVRSLTSSSAVVTWTTDEPATSGIRYGIDSASEHEQHDEALVVNHRLPLTGLDPGQTFQYAVFGEDQHGNGPVVSDTRTFTTENIVLSLPSLSHDPGQSIPIPVSIDGAGGHSIQNVNLTVQYDADLLSVTGLSADGTLTAYWSPPSLSTQTGSITLSLSGETPVSDRGVVINIEGVISPTARLGEGSVLTLSDVTLNEGAVPAVTRNGQLTVTDTRPPEITSGPEVAHLTGSSADIVWDTSEPATSRVDYGKTSDYGRRETSAVLTSDHRTRLTGLDPETTYHYRVSSVDSSGNGPTTSSDRTFTTQAGGDIEVSMENRTATVGSVVEIPIRVSDLGDDEVSRYHAVIAYDRSLLQFKELSTTNSILTGWTAPVVERVDGQLFIEQQGTVTPSGTGVWCTLLFTVRDEVINTHTTLSFSQFMFNSGYPTVTTRSAQIEIVGSPDSTPPHFLSGPTLDDIAATSTRVAWHTDEPSTAVIRYGRRGTAQQEVTRPLAMHHEQTLSDLESDALYDVQVGITDAAGNGPTWSPVDSFRTLSNETVVPVSIPTVKKEAGASVTLPIETGTLTHLKVYSASIALRYDSDRLQALDVVSNGTLSSAWGDPVYTLYPGRIVIAMGGVQPLSGSGPLVSIQFRVRDSASSGVMAPVIFEHCYFNEGAPQVRYQNGGIEIADRTAPVIDSGPVVTAVTPRSAMVLWGTDEPATSVVDYGPDTNYDVQKRSDQLSRGHVTVLSSLTPNTLYYLRVRSTDAAGNGPTSSQNITFRTASERQLSLAAPDLTVSSLSVISIPISISDVSGMGIQQIQWTVTLDSGVEIQSAITTGGIAASWPSPRLTTVEGSTTIILSGSAPLSGAGTLVTLQARVADTLSTGTLIPVALSSLVIDGQSAEAEYDDGSLSIVDIDPPIIISGPHASQITPNSAQIFWETDEPATSVIEYGQTPSLGQTLNDESLKTTHQLDLLNLQANTEYHYRVSSTDEWNNGPVQSELHTFSTVASLAGQIDLFCPDTSLAPGAAFRLPVFCENSESSALSGLRFNVVFPSDVMRFSSVTLKDGILESWDTLQWEETDNVLSLSMRGNSPVRQSGPIATLIGQIREDAPAGTLDSLRLTDASVNGGELAVTATTSSLRILDVIPPVFVQRPEVVQRSRSSVTIRWQSDEPHRGLVEYGVSNSYGDSLAVDSLADRHTAQVTDLNPSTRYHFRVALWDSSGNGPTWSDDRQVTTLSEQIEFFLADTTRSPGSRVDIPIRVQGLDGRQVSQIECIIDYDAELVSAERLVTDGTLIAEWPAPQFSTETGRVTVRAWGSEPISGDGILFFLGLRVSPQAQAGDVSDLSWNTVAIDETPVDASFLHDGQLAVTQEVPEEPVAVMLPDTIAHSDTTLWVPLRLSEGANDNILSFACTIEYDPEILAIDSVHYEGLLASEWTEWQVDKTTHSIHLSANGYPPLQDSGTLALLRIQTRPSIPAGYVSDLNIASMTFNQGSPPVEPHHGSVTLVKRPGTLSGFVYQAGSTMPVDSAIVRIESTGATTVSDDRGYFEFLYRSPQSYQMSADKAGYKPSALSDPVYPGGEDVVLTLEKLDGSIRGTIKDETGKPVEKALIVAQDGSGHFGSTNSDSSGSFEIGGLSRSARYELRVSKYGFYEKTIPDVAVNSVVNITLEHHYGTVQGTVRGRHREGVTLRLESTSGADEPETTRSDSTGFFQFISVAAGDYILSAYLDGYVSIPAQHHISVSPGEGTETGFRMEVARLESVTIQGENDIPNTETSTFQLVALSQSGREMNPKEPLWAIQPDTAGTVEQGILIPNEKYFGAAQIIAVESSKNLSDTLDISIYAPVGAQTDKILFTAGGLSLQISPGCVQQQQSLRIERRNLPSFQKTATNATAVGGTGYELKPSDLVLSQPFLLGLDNREGGSSGYAIGKWQKTDAEWMILNSTPSPESNQIQSEISSLGLFSLLIQSKPLAIQSIWFTPNPFSPDLDSDNDGYPGLTIHLKATSWQSRTPFVSIRIYNLLGDLVRELAVNRPVEKDREIHIVWDGRTGNGLFARNGRYLIHTELRDASGTTDHLATVVLVR
jgi:chitodextrinase